MNIKYTLLFILLYISINFNLLQAAEEVTAATDQTVTHRLTDYELQKDAVEMIDTIKSTGYNATNIIIIQTTIGFIALDIDYKTAPKSAAYFAQLVHNGFYDGLLFFRSIKHYLVQAGDPSNTGMGGFGNFVEDESSDTNMISGVVALAKYNGVKDSQDSQFYVLLNKSPWLQNDANIVGYIIYGMDHLNDIRPGSSEYNGLTPDPVKISKMASLTKYRDFKFLRTQEADILEMFIGNRRKLSGIDEYFSTAIHPESHYALLKEIEKKKAQKKEDRSRKLKPIAPPKGLQGAQETKGTKGDGKSAPAAAPNGKPKAESTKAPSPSK